MQTQDPAFLHECIREIQDAMQNNRLAVFVGSGVSVDSGLPTWQGIIEAFARGLYGDNWRMKFKGSLEDYLKIPQNYFLRYGEVSYLKLFHSFFYGCKV